MPEANNYELKNFYTTWEKYALQFLAPGTSVKSNFNLFNDPQFRQFMASSPVVTYVINHATSCYEFFSENSIRVTGYPSEEFIRGGVRFGMGITDEAYMDHVGSFLIPKVFQFAEKYARLNELNRIQFSYNYRIRRKDGTKIWILQLMSVIEADEDGNPLLTLFHLMDITHLKKDHRVDFCISRRNDQGVYDVVYMESYPHENGSGCVLSPREIEILTLLSKGESSKLIADKLNISVHTVNNHRKRMLEKTGCKNTSELINYGRCKGIAMPFI